MMSCSTSQSIACAERWHRILVLTHRSPGCRAVERVVGVTTGVTKLCASHGVCVRFRAARRHMRFCIRFTYVCAHVVFFIFDPSAVCSLTPSRSRVHRIRCSAWRPRSGPDSGPGCIRHPRRSALFCDSDCAVQARAHVANLPRGASPVSRRSSPTEGAIHVTPLSRIHQNWLEGPRNRECSRPSYLQPRAPRQNGRVDVVCTVGTW